MTDLVAEAIARLQKEKLDTETWLANEESWTSQDDIDRARYYLRIVDCHLAEFGEHEIVSVLGVGATCTCGATYFYYPEVPTVCHKAVTKSKRLLGKE